MGEKLTYEGALALLKEIEREGKGVLSTGDFGSGHKLAELWVGPDARSAAEGRSVSTEKHLLLFLFGPLEYAPRLRFRRGCQFKDDNVASNILSKLTKAFGEPEKDNQCTEDWCQEALVWWGGGER